MKKELRQKLMLTVSLIFLFRILNKIPLPFINPELMGSLFELTKTEKITLLGITGIQNILITSFAITSYVTASIALNLIKYLSPGLKRIYHRPGGSLTVRRYTYALTAVLAAGMSFQFLTSPASDNLFVLSKEWFIFIIMTIHMLAAIVVSVIGEKISENGIGDGISLFITSNILTQLPYVVIRNLRNENWDLNRILAYTLFFILFFCLCLAINTVESATLNVPVTIVRFENEKNKYIDSNVFFPIRLNLSGIMPLIVTTMLFGYLSPYLPKDNLMELSFWQKFLYQGTWQNNVSIIIVILILTVVISLTSFDTLTASKALKINGSVIDGIDAGKETELFLQKVLLKNSLLNACYLIILTFGTNWVFNFVGIHLIDSISLVIVLSTITNVIRTIRTQQTFLKIANFASY